MPTTSIESLQASTADAKNVSQRLKIAIQAAKRLGFEVRQIILDEQNPGWCQIGAKKVLFLDLGSTTNEQLQQIEEILQSYSDSCSQRQVA